MLSETEVSELLLRFEASPNGFAGMRIVLIDPDDPPFKNIYEDIEVDVVGMERMCVLSIYPECLRAEERGEDSFDDQEVLTHVKAMADIRKMLSMGYVVYTIEQDK